MNEVLATAIVDGTLAYLGVGLVFALAFVAKGAGRLDPDAVGGTWGFRVLILPGAAALWPLLAVKWLRASGTPAEQDDAHRRAAGGSR